MTSRKEAPIVHHKYDKKIYDDTYRDVNLAFKVVGIRISRNDSARAKFLWELLYWFEFINTVMVAVFEVTGALEIDGNNGDHSAIFAMTPCSSYCILAVLKTFKLVRHQRSYEIIINMLREMWPEDVSEEEHLVITTALKKLKFISKGYYWSSFWCASSFCVTSYFGILMRMFGREYPKQIPLYYPLPFDQYQTGVYESIVVIQSWHCSITLCFLLSGDLLFCILMCHITTQLDLLAIKIKNLIYVPIDKQLIEEYPLGGYNVRHNEEREMLSPEEEERKQYTELIDIVQRHQLLISMSEDVERLFSFGFLINFLTTSAIICTCGFCTLMVEKWNGVTYKLFLVSGLIQTWLICWYGQKLLDSSTNVADAAYNSGWYNTSKRIRSTIIILMQRCQKPVRITTYGFSTISLVSYTTIIKTAWSYFTMLLKMYND